MGRLARPLDELKPHYSVVVVGSGYGGSIAACRLARAGRTVCVLERGEERQPGELPERGWEGLRNIQAVSKSGRHVGSPNALFDLRLNDDINVLVGCGLGGTSLINANVALRARNDVFDEHWPAALRGNGSGVLDRYYELAEEMLRPVAFPAALLPPPQKLSALEVAAARAGHADAFVRPPITVTFADGENDFGVEQGKCTLCGDCCSGCNVGAKNTTLVNYLPDAADHGAEIFATVQVRTVERRAGRWLVRYHRTAAGTGPSEGSLTAEVVVLAAGTLGSTEILLRSRAERGLRLSHQLGHRFSGNGDVIGFGYDTDYPVNGVGRGRRRSDNPPGPCITGMVDFRDREKKDERIIVQDAAIPSLLGRLLPAAFFATATAERHDAATGRVRRGWAKTWRELKSVPFGPYHGPLSRSATYLVMSGDDSEGRIRMQGDRVRVDWRNVGDRPVFTRDNTDLAELAGSLGGTYLSDPLWAGGRDLITVHPLGGCAMADSAEHGVVDDRGRVFAASKGDEVHDGLYVADGSVIPTPLGVNPFLTISALSERTVDLLVRERHWTIEESPPSVGRGPRDGPTKPRGPGLRFRDTMGGFMSHDASSFEAGYRRGRADASSLEFELTIETDDLCALLADPSHRATATGSVIAPELSPDPLDARGTFQLFDPDPDHVETTRMWYRLELTAKDGQVYDLVGHKMIHGQGVADMWSDTTTLFFSLTSRGSSPRASQGILRIDARAVVRLVRTIRVTNTPSRRDRKRYVGQFLRVFLRVLWRSYAGVLELDYDFQPRPEARPRVLNAPKPDCHDVETDDGACVRLTRYAGGTKGPVLLAPGFGVTADSFAAATVDENLVERLANQGYDVWLFDYRASPKLVSNRNRRSADFSVDDIVDYDWPAAVDFVRAETGATSVQVVAHCVGSMSLLMAMTQGLEGVRSAVCSQLTLHAPTNPISHFKAGVGVADVFQLIGARVLDTSAPATRVNKALDLVLHLNPVLKGERCHSPVCRRIFGIFGPSYRHDQLNEATHRHLHAWFGRSSDIAFKQLATIVRKGVAVDRHGGDRYMRGLDRVRVPILFLAGDENDEFYPAASALTMRSLQRVNDPALYTRVVLPGYGHMDCFIGRSAATDVFPVIVEHLDAHAEVVTREDNSPPRDRDPSVAGGAGIANQ